MRYLLILRIPLVPKKFYMLNSAAIRRLKPFNVYNAHQMQLAYTPHDFIVEVLNLADIRQLCLQCSHDYYFTLELEQKPQ